MVKQANRFRKDFFSEIKEIPEIFNQSYLPSLDGLRAISIILVIVFHIIMSYKTTFSFDKFANLGVQFFFVISGFLITTLLIKEKVLKNGISLRNFYIRRSFRIIPVAYLYLFLVLILYFLLKQRLNFTYILTSFLFIRNFFNNATGINHLTTHYWSLSVEEQFYIIFPFIIKKSLKVYIYFLLGILLFSLILDVVSYWHLLDLSEVTYAPLIISLFTQFQGIVVGSLLSILLFKEKISFTNHNKTPKILLLFAAIILLTFYKGPFSNVVTLLKCLFFAIILILNLTVGDDGFYKLLNKKYVKLIGVLSFSIYIWQQPFTLNLTFLNNSKFMQRFDNKIPMDIAISVASLLVLGLISYMSYFYYEKRFLRLKERFK